MKEEKNIDTGKQENQSQDQFAAERLTDEELENVAGGADNPFPFPFSNQLESVAGGTRLHVQAFVEGYEPSTGIGSGKNREKAPLLPFEGHCH